MSGDPTTTSPTTAPGPTTPRRIGLVLALGGLLVVLDTTITVVAVPVVVADLGTTLAATSWITTGYLLGVVAVIPTAGWAAARLGDRPLYLLGLAVFTTTSLAAGLAPGIGWLVAARIAQGLGGGLLNPVGQAIGMRTVARGARGRMMSLLGLPVLIGPVLGPPLAGWLIDLVSWRAIFLINLPLGLVAMALVLRWIPGPPDSALPDSALPGAARPGFDVVGLALVVAGAVLVVLGATSAGDPAAPTALAAAGVVVGLVLLGAFVVHARRGAHPVLDLHLLRRPPIGGALAVLALFGAGYFGAITVLPVLVQSVRGDPAVLAGTLAIPQAIGVGVSLQVATRLVDRVPPRGIVVVGTALGVVGTLGLLGAAAAGAGYPVLVAASVVMGVGSGATISPTMTIVLRDTEGADTPRASTLLALVQQLAGALGIAAVASTISVALATAVPGLAAHPPGGVGAAQDLAPPERAALADGLAHGIAVGYALPAALMLAACVTAAVLLRPEQS